jgi:hypothetical protein
MTARVQLKRKSLVVILKGLAAKMNCLAVYSKSGSVFRRVLGLQSDRETVARQ